MKILGNIIWVVFGGLEMAVAYFCIGLLLMITIIGIPFGKQHFIPGFILETAKAI